MMSSMRSNGLSPLFVHLAEDRIGRVAAIRQYHLRRRGEALEPAELATRMRQHVDADAERPDFRRGLENTRANADRVEAQGEREPADTRSDDDDVHGPRVMETARSG